MKGREVAAYCRVDSGGTVESRRASLDFQRRELARCAEAEGLEITAYYEDNGCSAYELRRPGLGRMIKDCEAGRLSAVIVPSLGRLFRGEALAQPLWPFSVYTADFGEWYMER